MSPLQATRTIGTGDDWERTAGGVYVPEWAELDGIETAALPEQQPLGIDLFAGAGGFSCGFKQAGFHVIAASEAWHLAAMTYLTNLGSPTTLIHVLAPVEGDKDLRKRDRLVHDQHAGDTISAAEFFEHHERDRANAALDPGSGWISGQHGIQPCEHFYLGDVHDLTGERILDDLHLTGDDIGAVFGGPPCQGFSRAGKREEDDPRNELVFEFMRIVCEVHPRAFCMENVPGIMDMVTREGIPVIDALALMAQEGGMGTFEALRRSLAGTAGVGAALRTKTAKASRKQPAPGVSNTGHVEVEDDQLSLLEGAA